MGGSHGRVERVSAWGNGAYWGLSARSLDGCGTAGLWDRCGRPDVPGDPCGHGSEASRGRRGAVGAFNGTALDGVGAFVVVSSNSSNALWVPNSPSMLARSLGQ